MYIFILIIHIIVSLVLIGVILLQAGRGGGLAETFGGGGAQATIFGQKASTFLTRATTVSAVLFLCTSLSLAFLSSKRQKSLMEAVKVTQPAGKPALPTGAPLEEPESPKTAVEQVEEEAIPPTGEQEEKPAPVAEEEPPLTR